MGGGGRDELPTVRVASVLSEGPDLVEGSHPRAHPRPDPTHVGRYTVLRRLGEGGMGRVYLAFDPELDRNVAVKVMPRHPLRLRREAQAMAKLAHPNVATVFEVGWDDDTAFVAMEFIEGSTVRAWLDARPRRVGEVLATMIAAGQGLAAAHARGLVHRDFKPHNVMVGRDGAVKVLDFGLAVSPGEADTGADDTGEHRCLLSSPVTRTGTLMGTPAYMAPEHHRGELVDAKSDQFAYCVTLYEALWGQRPFAGRSIEELAVTVQAGQRTAAPRPAGVPAWLEAVIDRGLRTDPSERWPSMEALLDTLAKGAARRRRRAVAAGLGALAVGLAGVAVAQGVKASRQQAACVAEGEAIREHWNADAAASLRESFLATSVSHAAQTSDRLVPMLDAWTERWAATRQATCERTDVDDTWRPALGEASRACLDERRWALEELLAGLDAPDRAAVHRALPAAVGLPDVAACADEAELQLRSPAPTDASVRAEVDALRRRLAVVERLDDAGRPTEALAEARRVLADAKRVAHMPFVARAHFVAGGLATQTGAHEEGERLLEAGLQIALEAGADELVGSFFVELAFTVGYAQARTEDGRRWAALGDAWLSRRGRNEGLPRADLLNYLALLARAAGNVDEARRVAEEALAIREAAVGSDHPVVAVSVINLATACGMQGDYAESEALAERAVAILEHTYGSEHPHLASTLVVLANLRHLRGANAEALALFERARALYEDAYGRKHEEVADVLHNLAIVRAQMGELVEARRLATDALEIRERVLGRDHPAIAAALLTLAEIDRMRGELEAAHGFASEAVAIRERVLGATHPALAEALAALAELARTRGDVAAARTHLQRALEIRKEALGPGHPHVAQTAARLDAVDEGDAVAAASVAR